MKTFEEMAKYCPGNYFGCPYQLKVNYKPFIGWSKKKKCVEDHCPQWHFVKQIQTQDSCPKCGQYRPLTTYGNCGTKLVNTDDKSVVIPEVQNGNT